LTSIGSNGFLRTSRLSWESSRVSACSRGWSEYDSQIYGSLKGKVEFISPDTLKDDRRTEEETYYRVMVRTETGFLLHRGAQLPVIPGMTATVDILTGKRTVADYLLKPVLRLDEAFRER
jgi:adhesin transport system membrane fusion protein